MSKAHDYRTVGQDRLEQVLENLPNWGLKSGRLHALFTFKDFRTAFGFMMAVAIEAEKIDHHPDWTNSYNKVSIELITHQTDTITDFDLELAQEISEIYKGFKKS